MLDVNNLKGVVHELQRAFTDEVVQTPQEVRAEVARERREKAKARQLDRKVKRQTKRSQAY